MASRLRPRLTTVRVVGQVVVIGLGLPLVVVTFVRVLGTDLDHPWPAVLTVFPWLVAVACLALGVALVVRWWPAVLVAGVVVAVGAVLLAPRALPSRGPVVDDGGELVLAVANLRVGQADPARVVRVVEDHDVDVLVTLELTEPAIERLAQAGLDRVLTESVLEPSRLTSGGGIHSRLPVTALEPSDGRGFGRTPRATVEVTGVGPVVVDGVHPLPPVSADWTVRWRETLGSLGAPDPASDGRRILAGDFNATLDHAPFRALLDEGWVDAAAAVGAGLRPTFHGLPFGDPVPPVTLDHVLVDRDVAVDRVEVVPLPGSDHRMLVATLRLPAQ